MHSKHQPKRLRYKIPICMANLSWPEQQTRQILGVRDITHPPTDNIGNQFNDLPEENKFHARWDDPGLLQAMVRPPPRLNTSSKCRDMRLIDMMCVKERLQYHFGDLCIQYGGRESTGVTWMKFYEGDHYKPNGLGDLKLVLFLHEYNDLEVQGSKLDDLDWELTYPSDDDAAIKDEPIAAVQESSVVKTEQEGEIKDVGEKDVEMKYEDVTGAVDYFLSTAKTEETHEEVMKEVKGEDWHVAIKQEETQERDLNME